jgi:hypothetical protein
MDWSWRSVQLSTAVAGPQFPRFTDLINPIFMTNIAYECKMNRREALRHIFVAAGAMFVYKISVAL